MTKMKIFIVLAFCVASVFSTNSSPAITLKDLYRINSKEDRIISGTPATEGQFPWQVAIHFTTNDGVFFCGGALISETWILTAAHCAYGAVSFVLYLGGISLDDEESGRVTISTTTAIVHSGYNEFLNNDVALVKLNSPVSFNDRIQPIRLPSRDSKVNTNDKVRVSGWGKTSDAATSVSKRLNWVDLTAISNNQCIEIYGESTIISSTLCAVGHPEHSTCNGDSGGPLVIYDENGEATHHGVVSFVHIDGCASGNPSGYVRTESMLDWIAENTGLNV